MKLEFDSQFLISVVFLGFVGLLCYLYTLLVEKPNRLRSKLMKQGINGPPPTLLLGNLLELKKAQSATSKSSSEFPSSHNCAALLFPLFNKWRDQYGQVFMFSLGTIPILCVDQPDIVREFSVCTSLDLGKPAYQFKQQRPLVGKGVLYSNGAEWVHQRKIVAPELYMGKLKGMMNIISESAVSVLNLWSNKIEAEGGVADIKIDECLRNFSGNVISRACFGSSYAKSEEIFLKLNTLQELLSWKNMSKCIPGMSYLPTKTNREIWTLEKEVNEKILKVVKERKKSSFHQKDLLQMIFENVKDSNLSKNAIENFVVDNCKNMYLAGFESTAVAATWCLMLLASNQDWQDRVRTEVLEICNGRIPDLGMLGKMKQLAMVIHEALRLYPPVTVVSREFLKDMKFGNLDVPKGFNLWIMIVSLHSNPDIWGDDAYKFKPERFANGTIGSCKLPHVYMPFGLGPRVCLGQNLAIIELKMLISLILSKFTFSLSPHYVHSPTLRLLIEPEHGVNILVKKL
ncbi:hypothetical protein PHAVU_006G081800 [Phaseolus vulgaris]|uniref:Cytochrome P450 n=1 Tax=Phaseolus vulgaris TaxID=3885 RepID=V7BPF5_PHAVU|nr:hypothetical protein PHAVU_006G081800g [Phaseolus vulgaris]ESW18913.1 hypothetical protein PHAVU_006G081800g [Phaseolus vulgaris]